MNSPAAQRAIDAIANRLQNGITHPGDHTTKPTVLMLPAMRSSGIPPELAAQFAADAGLPDHDAPRVWAQAIIHLLTGPELDLELVPRAELAQLRAQATAPDTSAAAVINIHCRCNTTAALATITTSRQLVTLDGPALRQRLNQICKCPT